jgi:hypothetical protein
MTPNKRSRLLVVDASVARSAGETENPVSSCCRDSLLGILTICHRIVMTEAIQSEWNRHMSRFARRWLTSMWARKKVHRCNAVRLSHVDEACAGLSVAEQDGLRKDLLLLEAACAADGIIVTRDDAIQAIWHKCRDRLAAPKPITWINPVPDSIQTLEQL